MAVNNGPVTVTIQYDGDGNRVAKTVGATSTRYLVDDLNPTGYSQVVEELVGGTIQRTYTYGLQRINQNQLINGSWTQSFYGYDGFGSVRALTDSTGVVTDTYDYDAWGNTVNSTGSTINTYLYRGERYDPDLGLYYLRARYCNPLTGRFLTRDVTKRPVFDPPALHKYLYTGVNPVNQIDPTGWNSLTEWTNLMNPIYKIEVLSEAGAATEGLSNAAVIFATGRIAAKAICLAYSIAALAEWFGQGFPVNQFPFGVRLPLPKGPVPNAFPVCLAINWLL
jgi:RHS repeat-associated protein